MGKTILILSASPRKGGNSDTLCDAFLRGAIERGHTVEKIRIAEQTIRYCTGCGICNRTHQCVQTDDMAEILDKMVKADVIVLATPVYFYSMDAQLKTLIDRMVPRYTEVSNKDFYFLITAADTDARMLKRTVEGLRGLTADCLENAHECGVLYATGVWEKGDIARTAWMERAYTMGKEVACKPSERSSES